MTATYEFTKWYRSHKQAVNYANLLRLRGLTAEVRDGERNGYVVGWWLVTPYQTS